MQGLEVSATRGAFISDIFQTELHSVPLQSAGVVPSGFSHKKVDLTGKFTLPRCPGKFVGQVGTSGATSHRGQRTAKWRNKPEKTYWTFSHWDGENQTWLNQRLISYPSRGCGWSVITKKESWPSIHPSSDTVSSRGCHKRECKHIIHSFTHT